MKMWYWCFECERCFYIDVPDATEIEDIVKPDKCVYPGCNGTRESFRVWNSVRKTVKALYQIEYPEIPELNQVYPLSPENEGPVPVLRK